MSCLNIYIKVFKQQRGWNIQGFGLRYILKGFMIDRNVFYVFFVYILLYIKIYLRNYREFLQKILR